MIARSIFAPFETKHFSLFHWSQVNPRWSSSFQPSFVERRSSTALSFAFWVSWPSWPCQQIRLSQYRLLEGPWSAWVSLSSLNASFYWGTWLEIAWDYCLLPLSLKHLC
jgi:hypothetical protein